MTKSSFELVCPAGTLAALETAVDAGADTVYVGFRDETNARNFPGLNFSREELKRGVDYAHKKGSKIYVAINTYARAGDTNLWKNALKDAENLGVDAVVVADIGLLDYAQKHHPNLRKHLSVQASASTAETILFYHHAFHIHRVVLPRVLTIQEIANIHEQAPQVELEVFAFGGLCVMAEGRCSLSSYITGKSPNMCGVCSPASHVQYEERSDGLVSKLADFTINIFRHDEAVGYPTLCKGRFVVNDRPMYLFEEPTSLNALSILDQLQKAHVSALKIEGRQRGRAYIAEVVKTFREAIDSNHVNVSRLHAVSEGQRDTTGSFKREWQ